jgi:hypothetical protein
MADIPFHQGLAVGLAGMSKERAGTRLHANLPRIGVTKDDIRKPVRHERSAV